MRFCSFVIASLFLVGFSTMVVAAEPTRLLFGDTHVHTSYSFDAFVLGNQSADPDTAFRWAKGLPVIHPGNRARVQINTPLDFLVVADHAEFMGVIRAISNETVELAPLGPIDTVKRWVSIFLLNRAIKDFEKGKDFFKSVMAKPEMDHGGDPLKDPNYKPPGVVFGDTTKTETTAWHETIAAAERHNDPGKFTTLHGWEWSSLPTGANLHRVVFTPDGADKAKQFLPFGCDQSEYPEDLWQWLEETQARTGARFVAIPHNSNISKGYMFAETTLKDKPITADYARRRVDWEPVVEVTQKKGDSETFPTLSPDDEFADFETFRFYIEQGADRRNYVDRAGDYIRPALKRGLAIEEKIGVNPYKFGLIGSTDSHTGLSSHEEPNFWGGFGRDSRPENKRPDPYNPNVTNGWYMSASGLAAVWAKENTREEIYAAFKRKEVYATTGSRLRVRFFGGWDFKSGDVDSKKMAEIGYTKGVPMGGDLTRADSGKTPRFLIRAVKDPKGANLDRVQVIKGWLDRAGKQREKVFNVAWSGGRKLDTKGKLPAVGNTVDLTVPTYTNSIGEPELSVLWSDPTFDADQRAFYYVRVLQIPTPRHSTYDAVALQIPPPQEGPATIQERAYTSPIWYTP
jgi:hypothetical protein